MRIQTSGVGRSGPAFCFNFEDQTVLAYSGESFAAALIAAGIYGFRETRSGQLRGMFCGMGVCGDCQVLVDGESRRACMEPARAGVRVARHPALLSPRAPQPEKNTGAWIERAPDVLVIGAGPAGLSAAITAATAGLEVLVIDERKNAGGQYFKQPGAGFDVDEARLDPQFAEGRRLILDAQARGVQFCLGAVAWGIFHNNRVAVLTPDARLIVSPKRWVLSAGAYERALPVPGWTLPGVMTTGAAQTLLRAYQTAPGQRVLIAGNGPLNLQVADEMSKTGVKVAAVAELARAPWAVGVQTPIALALHSPTLAISGLRQLMNLRRRRVPVLYRHILTSVDGPDKVSRATVSVIDQSGTILEGTAKHYDVDAVCMNYGFMPQSELARALGCHFDYDPRTGRFQARRTNDGRSSIAHIFIAGDIGGLGGARIAVDQGTLAGMAIVDDLLGDLRRSKQDATGNNRRIDRRLRRNARFQTALWHMFSAPFVTIEHSRPDTLICRCEEIDRQSLERTIKRRHLSLPGLKKVTRIGMGRCQGRYCTTLIAAMSIQNGNPLATSDDFFAPRPPAKPVPIGRLAYPYGTPLQAEDVNSANGQDANKLL